MTFPESLTEWHAYLDALPRPEVGLCPQWCTAASESSHRLTPDDSDGEEWTRYHTTSSASIQTRDGDVEKMSVEIEQMETITEAESRLEGVELMVGGVGVMPGQARRFAAALLNAADRYDEVVAAR